MRAYGKIETGIWNSRKVRGLSDQGKLLFTYIVACPHGNSLGCFVLHAGYITADLEWDSKRVSKHLSELVSAGLIEMDSRTSLIRIIGWWGHNTIENPKVAIAAANTLALLPRCAVFYAAIQEIRRVGNVFMAPHVEAIETPSQTSIETRHDIARAFPEPDPEPEPEPETNSRPSGRGVSQANGFHPPAEPAGFERFWAVYPRHIAKGAARKAWLPAARKTEPERIIAAAERFRTANAGQDPRYIPHASTWLNQERWLDEPDAEPRAAGSTTRLLAEMTGEESLQ